MSESAPRTARLRALGIGLAAVVFALHAAVAAQNWVIDDAYITFRYARNLAHGNGLVFNLGERVEGYTNFSWLLLSSACTALGLEPATVMRFVGVGCGVALVLTVASASRRFAIAAGSDARFAGLPAAILVATSTPLAFYSATGLETALFALLMTGAAVALIENRPEAFALWTGAAFLTRPEAGLLGAVGIAVSFARARSPRTGVRRALRATALLAIVVLPYLCFKLWYFGALVPNTFAAKPPSVRDGLVYVGWLLPELAGLVVLAATASFRDGKPTRAGAALGLFALHFAAVVFEGGDWMRFGRLLVPWFGCLAIAVDGRALALISDVARRRYRALILLAVAATYFPLTWLDFSDMHDYVGADAVDVYRADLARRVRASGASSLAAFDVGLVGYVAPELSITDLAGLTDRTIGHAPGRHYEKRPSAEYLARRNPDAFFIVSKNAHGPAGANDWFGLDCHYETDRYVLGLPWFRATYRHAGTLRIDPAYFIHWFARVREPSLSQSPPRSAPSR